MNNGFQLLVDCQGKRKQLNAKFIRLGYIHQFHVNVEGKALIVEFDEEKKYRVINPEPGNETNVPAELISLIVDKISQLHR